MTSPVAMMTKSEARLFAREPMAIFWVIAFPVLLLGILGLVPAFREVSEELGGQTVVQLYVSICILLTMIVAGIQVMPETITGYRERKVLRRLRTTPVSPAVLLQAQGVVWAGAIMVGSILCLIIGRVFLGAPLPQAPAGYVIVFVLALASSLATGAAIAAVAPTSKASQIVAMAVFFPTMFTAGVWVPVQVMPDTLQTLVHLTPMGAAALALNQATLGDFPDLAHLVVMAAWSAVLSLVAAHTFRWE